MLHLDGQPNLLVASSSFWLPRFLRSRNGCPFSASNLASASLCNLFPSRVAEYAVGMRRKHLALADRLAVVLFPAVMRISRPARSESLVANIPLRFLTQSVSGIKSGLVAGSVQDSLHHPDLMAAGDERGAGGAAVFAQRGAGACPADFRGLTARERPIACASLPIPTAGARCTCTWVASSINASGGPFRPPGILAASAARTHNPASKRITLTGPEPIALSPTAPRTVAAAGRLAQIVNAPAGRR